MFRSGKSLVKYVIAFFLGLLCAMPCLWAPACLLEKHMRENLTRSRTRRCSSNLSHFSVQDTSNWETCPQCPGARRAQFSNTWGWSRGCFTELPQPALPVRTNHAPRKSGWIWCSAVVWCCYERRKLILLKVQLRPSFELGVGRFSKDQVF